MDRLKGAVSGGRGGRGGRGRKRGGKKGMRDTQAIWIGQGVYFGSDAGPRPLSCEIVCIYMYFCYMSTPVVL